METESHNQGGRGRKINKVHETSLGPKGILLGGIAPNNKQYQQQLANSKSTTVGLSWRAKSTECDSQRVASTMEQPQNCCLFLVLYVAGARTHALSNDVNILIMRNPLVTAVYFNTIVEQTIKSDEAA